MNDKQAIKIAKSFVISILLSAPSPSSRRPPRPRISQVFFRSEGRALRPDALAYCLGALQRFDGMPRSDIQKISFEIAMLGAQGLQVDDPAD